MPLYERNGERIYFIHIPKCGGTSLKLLLKENGWKEIFKEKIPVHITHTDWKHIPEILECEFKFALVRDPFSRLLSHVNMWIDHIADERNEKLTKMLNSKIDLENIFLGEISYLFSCFLEKQNPKELAKEFNKISSAEDWNETMPKFLGLFDEMKKALDQDDSKVRWRSLLVKDTFKLGFGKSFEESTLSEIFLFFLKSQIFEINTPGGNPAPACSYLSSDSVVYKLEDLDCLLNALLEKKIISKKSHSSKFPTENRRKNCLSVPKEIGIKNLDIEAITVIEFLYSQDWDILGYKR